MTRWQRIAGLGSTVALLGAAATLVPGGLRLEETIGLEALFRLRGPLPPPTEVAVIAIDRASATALDQPPRTDRWSRALHAELIERLSALGVAVLAFDIIFEAPREAPQDLRLAAALADAGNVLLLERVRSEIVPLGTAPARRPAVHSLEARTLPIPPFKQAALGSAPFPLPVVPIKVSQFWAFGRSSTDLPTLPAVALLAYARPVWADFVELVQRVRPALSTQLPAELPRTGLEDLARLLRQAFQQDRLLAAELQAALTPTRTASRLTALIALHAGADTRYLNYYGPQRSLLTVPYHRVLDGTLPEEQQAALRGRVVFVGFSETRQAEQQDAFYSVFSEDTGLNLGGVEIAATAFANLLHDNATRTLSLPSHWGLLMAWALALAAVLSGSRSVMLALTGTAVLGGAYAMLALGLFERTNLWWPLVIPLGIQLPAAAFLALTWHYRRARVQAERVQRALGFYLPPRVVDTLARETVDLDARAQLLYGTCLVTDVEQYTALAEGMAPDALRTLLNDYYRVLFEQVQRHEGLVSDIVGDSMVAVWARAEPVPAIRLQACRAALAILDDLAAFNCAAGHQDLPTRVGLHFGQVMLGTVGAAQHFEYRAIGDIVNTASRIQGLNKHLGTRLLASAETLAGLEQLVARPLGTFVLAGKQTPLEICELIGARQAGAAIPAWPRFAAALEHFRAARWTEAEAAFTRVLRDDPADGAARFYRELCDRYAQNPAGAPRDGIVRMTGK